MADGAERSAVLIIRVWLGVEGAELFRVRMTDLVELGDVETSVATASDVDGVLAGVRVWLERVARPG